MPSAPAISASVTPTGTGYTRATYYRRLASELGFYHASATTATPSGGDQTRVLQINELRDDEVGYQLYPRVWAYVASGLQAGTQRRIIAPHDAGYQGELGVLLVSRPFSAAVQSGSTVEVTSPLPILRHLGVKGLVDCVNEALGLINIRVIATVTGNGGYTYDLASLPHITDTSQIIGVYDTAYLDPTYPAERSPWPVEIRTDGPDHTLVTRRIYSTAETFDLHLIVKANRLRYDGSAWSYLGNNATLGLQADSQQAAAPLGWVHTFAMVKALQHLRLVIAQRNGVEPNARRFAMAEVEDRLQKWAQAAARIKVKEFPRPLPQRKGALVYADDSGPGWN